MSLMLICKLSTPLNVFISNTPATSILSPILYSFAKYPILNPIAFMNNTYGTEKGRMSKNRITKDMLMYNRNNFRDIKHNIDIFTYKFHF